MLDQIRPRRRQGAVARLARRAALTLAVQAVTWPVADAGAETAGQSFGANAAVQAQRTLSSLASRLAGAVWAPSPTQPAAVNCSDMASAVGASALHQLRQCGFLALQDAVAPAAVARFAADWQAFVADSPARATELSFTATPGVPVDDRYVIEIPPEDPRFARERVQELLAPPRVIALLDAYFGAGVEFDAFMLIRTHGCKNGSRQRCDWSDTNVTRKDGEKRGGYLWVSDHPTGFHAPCCAGGDQEFHRDLDHPGTITVNIPLQRQRPGFGPVSYCLMNATGLGTHVAPNDDALALRTHDRHLDLLFEPTGWLNQGRSMKHDAMYYEVLEPLCNPELASGRPAKWGGREVVTPLLDVGDVAMYDSTAMHKGTSNTEDDDRDVLSLQYVWRGCPAGMRMSPEWKCAECFHCAEKGGWADSPYGVDGPGGQRPKLADVYHRRQDEVRGLLEGVRQSPQYAEAARALRGYPAGHVSMPGDL